MVTNVFLLLAALLAALCGGAMLWPLFRAGKRRIWGALVAGMVVATLGLYQLLGTPAGLQPQAELAAAADDRRWREMRGFEEHVAGRVGDLGIEPPHDPTQRNGTRSAAAATIGDHQELVVERHRTAVQQRDGLVAQFAVVTLEQD